MGCAHCSTKHECFKKLADEARVKILEKLQTKEASVGELTKHLGLTQPTVSHHLKVLEQYGFVKKRKEDRHVIYSFNTKYPCRKCGVIHL